jgi:hypothetical protein
VAVSTFQAIIVFLLAVLPGALYTWAYEREDGAWEVALSDRLARFTGVSAMFSVLTAPLIYAMYRMYTGSWQAEGTLRIPWWVCLVYAAYVIAPAWLGYAVGRGARNRRRWTRVFTGPSPAPRGWDALFRSPALTGWLRLRLKDGTWIAGVWADPADDGGARPGSYAAGFPHPQDLYLVDTCEVDPESGAILVDDAGQPVQRGIGLLVNWDQVVYAEFIDA